jgi:hypothetical protein
VNRAELADQTAADLDTLADALRWAHTDGYWPEAPNPERSTRRPTTAHTDGLTANPDHVPGPRHDTGIGNHRRRTALRRAIVDIAKVEQNLVVAAYLAGADRQPVAVAPTAASTPHELTTCVTHARRRLDLIRRGGPSKRADQLLDRAARAADRAWRIMAKAFAEGAAGDQAVAEPMCKTCGIRPRADRRTECKTCATWRQRNGAQRPKKLDDEHRRQVLAAKARRVRRGEGWGDESFAAVVAKSAAEWEIFDGPAATEASRRRRRVFEER